VCTYIVSKHSVLREVGMVFHSQVLSLEDGNLATTGKRNDSVKYSSKLVGLLQTDVFGIWRQPKNYAVLYMKTYCVV